MATKAFIQNLIDTNLANDSNILPSEHRAVEDALLTEQFPSAVKVEWDGEAPVDPTANIICSGTLSEPDNVAFTVNFWKQGNTVYFNGEIESLSTSSAIDSLQLITFPTTLYKPLTTSKIKVSLINNYDQEAKQVIWLTDTGVYISGGLPAQLGATITWSFNGSYKVTN